MQAGICLQTRDFLCTHTQRFPILDLISEFWKLIPMPPLGKKLENKGDFLWLTCLELAALWDRSVSNQSIFRKISSPFWPCRTGQIWPTVLVPDVLQQWLQLPFPWNVRFLAFKYWFSLLRLLVEALLLSRHCSVLQDCLYEWDVIIIPAWRMHSMCCDTQNLGNLGMCVFLWEWINALKAEELCLLTEAFQTSWLLPSLFLAHGSFPCFSAGPTDTAGQGLATHSHLNEWSKYSKQQCFHTSDVVYVFAVHCRIKKGKKKCLKYNNCSLLIRLKWSCQWSLPVESSAWRGCHHGNRRGSLGSRLLLSPSEWMGWISPYWFLRKPISQWVAPVLMPLRDFLVQSAPLG